MLLLKDLSRRLGLRLSSSILSGVHSVLPVPPEPRMSLVILAGERFFLHNALIICLNVIPLVFPSHRFYVRAAVARGGGRLGGEERL